MPIPMQKSILKASLSPNGSSDGGSSGVPARCRAPSVGIDVDMVSEFDPSSSDSGVVSRCAVVKPLKLRLCRPIFGRKAIGKHKREHADPGKHSAKETQEDIKPAKPRDPEREKRRLARKKEKRATLILGLIMGSFIACWLPFFFLYIVKPLFPTLEIPVQAFAIAFWLGYMNSALNPVIYTVFNKDFRRAFRRILYKWFVAGSVQSPTRTPREHDTQNPKHAVRKRWWTFVSCGQKKGINRTAKIDGETTFWTSDLNSMKETVARAHEERGRSKMITKRISTVLSHRWTSRS